jgi:acetoin:2,6-dichlorophenolindophenol oxidoreductase subunit beta
MTVAETIRDITRKHLENGGVAMGQCLSAVGWVGGTVPEMSKEEGIIELSMDDTSNTAAAIGYALAGIRPIQIVRYQGFMHINASMFVNYAAKSKEMWGIPCPIYMRAIAMEGGIGPVASNSHHSLIARMPGLRVIAPMTPMEIEIAWQSFTKDDCPYYVSEHRRSFKIDYEIPDIIRPDAHITLFAISATRIDALKALEMLEQEGIVANLVNLLWLKPFVVEDRILDALESSRCGGVVLDGDYENGLSKCIAYDIMQKSDRRLEVMGLKERSAGFAPNLDNLPPSPEEIVTKVKSIVR